MGIANLSGHQRRCHIVFHLLLRLPAALIAVVVVVVLILLLFLLPLSVLFVKDIGI
jgi:type II secretory pathway component PulF